MIGRPQARANKWSPKRADELGYLGRATRPKLPTIEIILHDWDIANSELWANVQRGAQLEARSCGYGTVVRWMRDPRILGELERNATGFILIGPHDRAMMEAAHASSVRVVALGSGSAPLDTIDRVSTTDAEAGAYVASYLHDLGHRTMLYVHGEAGRYGRLERLRGFRDTLSTLSGTHLRELAFDETIGEKDAVSLLSGYPCTCDGLPVAGPAVRLKRGRNPARQLHQRPARARRPHGHA